MRRLNQALQIGIVAQSSLDLEMVCDGIPKVTRRTGGHWRKPYHSDAEPCQSIKALNNASEIAGTIVTRGLSVINLGGFLLSATLLVLTVLIARRIGRFYPVQLALLGVILIATAMGHWLIAAKMRAIRAALELPIDQIPLDDPRRLAFDNLHHYSVLALGIAMVAALVATVLVRFPPGE